MLLVSYDISDDKLRTKFAKFISKYGNRLQYSVFEVKNSDRMLNNIRTEIEHRFCKAFSQSDSVYIFSIEDDKKTVKYGYAANENDDFSIIG